MKTHLEAAEDPQVRHINAITSYDHPKAGQVKVVAPAVKMSETPASVERLAPMIGEHTMQILADFGFTAEETRAFLANGAVAQAEDRVATTE